MQRKWKLGNDRAMKISFSRGIKYTCKSWRKWLQETFHGGSPKASYLRLILNYYERSLIITKVNARVLIAPSCFNYLQSQIKLGRISLDCMCRMLLTHPYFNLSVNITNFIIPFLNNWNPDVRKVLVDTLKVVFRNDKRGEISYEVSIFSPILTDS